MKKVADMSAEEIHGNRKWPAWFTTEQARLQMKHEEKGSLHRRGQVRSGIVTTTLAEIRIHGQPTIEAAGRPKSMETYRRDITLEVLHRYRQKCEEALDAGYLAPLPSRFEGLALKGIRVVVSERRQPPARPTAEQSTIENTLNEATSPVVLATYRASQS
jgi:hypothetical protein